MGGITSKHTSDTTANCQSFARYSPPYPDGASDSQGASPAAGGPEDVESGAAAEAAAQKRAVAFSSAAGMNKNSFFCI